MLLTPIWGTFLSFDGKDPLLNGMPVNEPKRRQIMNQNIGLVMVIMKPLESHDAFQESHQMQLYNLHANFQPII